MKKVFKDRHEVAHIWAQQTQYEGRAGSMFFRGKSIFSYGEHFEIARFVNKDVVLFTKRNYSVSTAQHKQITRNAIPGGIEVIEVWDFNDPIKNIELTLQDYITERESILRAKSFVSTRIAMLLHGYKNLQLYTKLFKVKKSIVKKIEKELEKFHQLDFSSARARETQYSLLQKERIEQKWVQRKKLEAEALIQWKNGEDIRRGFSTTALRAKDGYIETTHGARILIAEAIKLYKALNSGQPVHGLKVGDYTVIGWDNERQVLIIGCHRIPAIEIERMAEILGLKNTEEK